MTIDIADEQTIPVTATNERPKDDSHTPVFTETRPKEETAGILEQEVNITGEFGRFVICESYIWLQDPVKSSTLSNRSGPKHGL